MTRFWNIWGVNPFLLWYEVAKAIIRPRRIASDVRLVAEGYGRSYHWRLPTTARTS